ncbi:MAG: hypothetical protein HOG89_04365 [Candidatus Peribacter sp.]|jgi:hypothetical protein|nr:hypothetical protein [Candidatus Peribacter sp.]MBT4393401.1 hypothetical protein [Candidatus Peribacter sp.]MBT4600760.1 hypothetical protein [Candidatus Peribacter sp.]MBT5149194.1 hypothetical protein [Candidatus Peribacter sp.]MBT5637833.1 hypothetical protein [Candidatus Peribacter sp.]
MKKLSSANSGVDLRELTLREWECELELAHDLFLKDPDAGDLVAAVDEATSFKEEKGLTHWQSVAAFAQAYPEDWKRLCADPRMQWLAKGFDSRYGHIIKMNAGLPRETVNRFDETLHKQVHAVAAGIHDVLFLANEKRAAYGSGNRIDLQEVTNAMKTRTVSTITDPATDPSNMLERRKITGIVVGAYAPTVTELGKLDQNNMVPLRPSVQAGPAFQ